MFLKHSHVTPTRFSEILNAAEAAARAIPPAFPLDATVAVNPFLGQVDENLASASARLARVSSCAITRPAEEYMAAIREDRITNEDLAEALKSSDIDGKPANVGALKVAAAACSARQSRALPTIADLAAEESGIDWPSVINKTFGQWAAGHFDRGQALWSPTPGQDAFAAWRAWATNDLTPEIAGLKGFCAYVANAPDTAERAILNAAGALSLSEPSAETAFHRLYMDIGGWSQHARWLLWQAELVEESDRTLVNVLAIRLIWEEALLAQYPQVSTRWKETLDAHAAPIAPTSEQITLAILQDASERVYQRHLARALNGSEAVIHRPALQAAFCIDVRSEVFRRALETVDDKIETIGFAGFFGLPLSHKAHGSDTVEARLPVLLNPAIETSSAGDLEKDHSVRISARSKRAWGRFRQAAVSSFAFVESMGPIYAAKLVYNALGRSTGEAKAEPMPEVVGGLSAQTKVDTAQAVLKAMSMTKDFGEVVLLLGHGGNMTNNPHESAYHCGACGGHTGDVSARVLANLLNDPETRDGLVARAITVPQDTVFVAGLHDTTTDTVTMYAQDLENAHTANLKQIEDWLNKATSLTRAERALSLPGATKRTIAARAYNWAEVRPEWGLAGCGAFIAAPRHSTAGKDLGGRAFLHSYDWQADEGFGTLELIMTAPVVVASWISLQYYGSSVAPAMFGGGNKLIHNVVGGIGVIQGNSGQLRPGLPIQSVHDGERLVHEPLRLSVMVEAPREAIIDVLKKHPQVQALFDNGWLHLFTLKNGCVDARYGPGLSWVLSV